MNTCTAHKHEYGLSPSLRLRVNRALSTDPTHTTGIRNRYAADMTRRFTKLKKLITETIVTNDAFGLKRVKIPKLKLFAAAPPKAFAFTTDARKVEGFMDWLGEQQDLEILEVKARDGVRVVNRTPWQNVYIDTSYKKGIRRGHDELIKSGLLPEAVADEPFFIESSFLQPIHADRVAALYTRNFQELRGVTAAMDQAIGRTLAEGMASGLGPRQIARNLNRQVDKIGIRRATVLARTEVIRAHHVATIGTYRQARVEGVRVKAEWDTAGDDRVCEDCAFMEGRVFSLDEVEGLIPLHPLCRCVAIPAGVGEKPGKVTRQDRIDAVGDQAKNKDGSFKRRGFFEEKTGKVLPDAPAPGVTVKGTPPPESEMVRRRAVAAKARKKARARAKAEGRTPPVPRQRRAPTPRRREAPLPTAPERWVGPDGQVMQGVLKGSRALPGAERKALSEILPEVDPLFNFRERELFTLKGTDLTGVNQIAFRKEGAFALVDGEMTTMGFGTRALKAKNKYSVGASMVHEVNHYSRTKGVGAFFGTTNVDEQVTVKAAHRFLNRHTKGVFRRKDRQEVKQMVDAWTKQVQSASGHGVVMARPSNFPKSAWDVLLKKTEPSITKKGFIVTYGT